MANKVMLAATLVIMCLGSGCGIYDRQVRLVYNRAVSGAHSERGGAIYVEMPACPKLVKQGKKSHIVGEIDIGGSANVGTMLTTDSVAEWIGNALCTELTAAGFTPQIVEKLPSTVDRGISTYLVRAWLDGSAATLFNAVDATAEVHLRISLHQRGQVVQEFDARCNGCCEPCESLTIALENCMKKALPVIVAGLAE